VQEDGDQGALLQPGCSRGNIQTEDVGAPNRRERVKAVWRGHGNSRCPRASGIESGPGERELEKRVAGASRSDQLPG